jgi:hypothetical protein
MIEIHVYGKLRRFAPDRSASRDSVIHIQPAQDDTVHAVLDRIGLDVQEIATIFLNAELLATRNTMARWLGYVQVRSDPHDWDLFLPVKDGDRLGLFGEDMAGLVV